MGGLHIGNALPFLGTAIKHLNVYSWSLAHNVVVACFFLAIGLALGGVLAARGKTLNPVMRLSGMAFGLAAAAGIVAVSVAAHLSDLRWLPPKERQMWHFAT